MFDDKYKVSGLCDYEIDSWLERLGSVPTAVIAEHDRSESYEMDRASVLKLTSGQFALVTESGCPCCDTSDANIDLYPSEDTAMEAFKRWKEAR